jgi:hypothetical protein
VILAHSIYSSTQRDIWKQRDFLSWGIPVSENILRQNQGFTVARIDMVYSKSGWRQESQAKIIPLNANLASADPAILKALSPFADKIRAADEVLGKIDESVSEEALLKHHLAALSRIAEANIVFYSDTSVRGGLEPGKLTASRLYNALPWTNDLSLIELTAEQFGHLKRMKGYVTLSRPGAGLRPVVVSSRYFARLLQSSLGLNEAQIKPAGKLNEFDFVKEALKAGMAVPSANPELGGWIYERLE